MEEDGGSGMVPEERGLPTGRGRGRPWSLLIELGAASWRWPLPLGSLGEGLKL